VAQDQSQKHHHKAEENKAVAQDESQKHHHKAKENKAMAQDESQKYHHKAEDKKAVAQDESQKHHHKAEEKAEDKATAPGTLIAVAPLREGKVKDKAAAPGMKPPATTCLGWYSEDADVPLIVRASPEEECQLGRLVHFATRKAI
jgi:hypothetical protein